MSIIAFVGFYVNTENKKTAIIRGLMSYKILRRHLVGYFVLPDHFRMVLLVGHDRVEHVANVGRRKIEQVVIVSCGNVLFGGDYVGAKKLVEVIARLIAGVFALRLVLDGNGRSVLDLRSCAVHETREHVVMRLLVLENFFEKIFEFGVFGLRRVKIVLLHAKLLLSFQLGYELYFFLVKLHFHVFAHRFAETFRRAILLFYFVSENDYCPISRVYSELPYFLFNAKFYGLSKCA